MRGEKGMRRGGRLTQAQLISMGTNKHLQNMTGLRSTRPFGQSTVFKSTLQFQSPSTGSIGLLSTSADTGQHVNVSTHTEPAAFYLVNL